MAQLDEGRMFEEAMKFVNEESGHMLVELEEKLVY